MENTPPPAYPYFDIPYADLPDISESRQGFDYLRNVAELQVGSSGNVPNPKVMRADKSGLWLGQKSFIEPINPEPTPTGDFRFQVDMQGNATAVSFKTGFTGSRIRIFEDKLESYDSSTPTPRVELTSDRLTFYDTDGIKTLETQNDEFRSFDNTGLLRALLRSDSLSFFDATGQVRNNIDGDDMTFFNASGGIAAIMVAYDTPTNAFAIDVTNDFFFAVSSSIKLAYINSLSTFFLESSVRLASLAADPAGINGAMYYANASHPTDPDELRVYKGGSWRNVLTT